MFCLGWLNAGSGCSFDLADPLLRRRLAVGVVCFVSRLTLCCLLAGCMTWLLCAQAAARCLGGWMSGLSARLLNFLNTVVCCLVGGLMTWAHFRSQQNAIVRRMHCHDPHAHTMCPSCLLAFQEALYVCRGAEGANAVMRMSPAAQDELWRCVAGGRGPEAAPGWAGLRAAPSAVSGVCQKPKALSATVQQALSAAVLEA